MKAAILFSEFRQFLWNKQTKEVAGRTGKSWLEISVFFVVLYLTLAAFWASFLYLIQLRLPAVEEGPLYSDYLTHRGPGLHMIPETSISGTDKQKIYNLDEIETYLNRIDEFFKARADNVEDFGNCSKESFRSEWENNNLCLYFYLNAIHNFVPEPESGKVTMECKSAKSKYNQFFESAQYYPDTGFDLDKFPWKYGVDWHKDAPVVAVLVELTDKMNEDSAEARIMCKVKARNIYPDLERPNIGMADFRVRK